MLEADQIHHTYPEANQRHVILDGVSLSLRKGEHVALTGHSGSGKSTLLNLLGGIDTPERGEIRIDGHPLSQLKEPELTLFRRTRIGFIYQQFNLIPTLTVAENILLPLELQGIGRAEQQTRLDYWLDAVQLPSRARAFPDQLSGGEQQRVAIARALIHRPALLLADEPTGNLDARTGERILDLLFTLAREARQTLLIVTHSKAVAERADRIVVLMNGQLQTGSHGFDW